MSAHGLRRSARRAVVAAGTAFATFTTLTAITTLVASSPLPAQETSVAAPLVAAPLVARGLEAESAGKNREAIAAYRAAIAAGAVLPGVLGLERVFSVLAQEDSLLVALDTLVPLHPRDAQLRGAQLRTLATVGRDEAARRAYEGWRDQSPTDVAPYREYARVLLFNNRAGAADTVLREASAALGSTRALVLEVAQMRAALGLWREAAEAWRAAMIEEPYYESATVFSLSPTPPPARDGVRAELARAGAPLGATQALAFLEVAWGAPRTGWLALATLAPSDTVVAIWRQFADEVERARAWATARDAFVAIDGARPDPAIALRGATAALNADDAAAALRLVRRAAPAIDGTRGLSEVLPIELEALARLGQATEAERVLARAGAALGEDGVRGYARAIAGAWIRAGDVARARAALAGATLSAEDAVAGWLALFDGDLAAARLALRNTEVPGQDAISALALLNRTRQATSVSIGTAFLTLARGDTALASRRFESAATDLPDAAPLLLAIAARLESARRNEDRALALWQRVAGQYADAPEAPEAQLEWARGLRRRGDLTAAREHLEQLILMYPKSALVPQARRELDALRTGAVS